MPEVKYCGKKDKEGSYTCVNIKRKRVYVRGNQQKYLHKEYLNIVFRNGMNPNYEGKRKWIPIGWICPKCLDVGFEI